MDSILFQLLNLKDMDQLDPSTNIPTLSEDDDTKVQLLRSDREIIICRRYSSKWRGQLDGSFRMPIQRYNICLLGPAQCDRSIDRDDADDGRPALRRKQAEVDLLLLDGDDEEEKTTY